MKHTRTHQRTTKKLLHFIIPSFYLLLGQFLIRGITSFTSHRMMRYSVINNNKHDPTINLLRMIATATEESSSSSLSSPKSSSSSSSEKKHHPLHSVQSMFMGQQSIHNDGDSTVENTETTTSTTVVSSSSSSSSSTTVSATIGDIITLNLELVPEDGFVPEHLFDSSGEIIFVLGWGNYLPGVHELVLSSSSGSEDGTGMSVGEAVTNISIDAGFGRHNPELVIEIPKRNLQMNKNDSNNKNFIVEEIKPNTTLNLQGGIEVTVLEVTTDSIVVDANHPLAGASYLCSFTLVRIDPFPIHKLGSNSNIAPATKEDTTSNTNRNELEEEELATSRSTTTTTTSTPFEIATFSMGCFWGVELAFMRTKGVVGTRVGYSNGSVVNPSYAEIKEGNTQHRESVMVIYDARVTSYHEILAVYKERFAITSIEYGASPLVQYQHGIYFHTNKQKEQAKEFISSAINSNNNCAVDLLPATTFYNAEERHQQYLYKGGQAARKGCRDIIRCHG